MVKCEFCLNFNGKYCVETGERIDDPMEERDCPYYLEKAFAGLMGLGLFRF